MGQSAASRIHDRLLYNKYNHMKAKDGDMPACRHEKATDGMPKRPCPPGVHVWGHHDVSGSPVTPCIPYTVKGSPKPPCLSQIGDESQQQLWPATTDMHGQQTACNTYRCTCTAWSNWQSSRAHIPAAPAPAAASTCQHWPHNPCTCAMHTW
jgi:hypothetical protein